MKIINVHKIIKTSQCSWQYIMLQSAIRIYKPLSLLLGSTSNMPNKAWNEYCKSSLPSLWFHFYYRWCRQVFLFWNILLQKNTKLDQNLNRTNFSSENQKAMKRQFWWVKKAAPLIWQCVQLKLPKGWQHWHHPGSQFCCHVWYITRNTHPNMVTIWLQHIHSAYNCVTEENNLKSFGFGVPILATVRKGTSTVIITISFWGRN